MNTQEGMNLIYSLSSEYASRRRHDVEVIRANMQREFERGNATAAIELAKELKNWSLK